MTKVSTLWLVKAIACHSLTGLNIIIFHDGLFNISYCHYKQQEKLENNYNTSFWKSQRFFKKPNLHKCQDPLPLFVFLYFSMTPSPPPSSQRTYFLNDPQHRLDIPFLSFIICFVPNLMPIIINLFLKPDPMDYRCLVVKFKLYSCSFDISILTVTIQLSQLEELAEIKLLIGLMCECSLQLLSTPIKKI